MFCPPTIINIQCGPFANGSTPVITGQIVNNVGNGLSLADIATLTLSLVDSGTQAIINGVNQVNILNTGRGVVDNQGNMTITLESGDTSMTEVPGYRTVRRSAIIDCTGTDGTVIRMQINFQIVQLYGP